MTAPTRGRRRGLASVAVLVLLFVISIVAASLVRVSVIYHQRTRSHERGLQSELLADAGLDRAYARLAADPKYPGERWEIAADSLGLAAREASPAAIVIIEVAAPSEGGPRRIRVHADYPTDPAHRVRSSREVTLP